jgi:hypothetical protein
MSRPSTDLTCALEKRRRRGIMAGAREEPAVWRSAIQVAQLLSPTKWKRTPEGAKACCPCHDDNDPSLYISESDEGKLIIFCQACQHAGQQLILDELQARGIRLFRDACRATTDSKTKLRNVERLVATHFATDAQGEQIHKKLRYEEFTPDGTRTGKKRFDWLTKYGHNGSAQWKRAASTAHRRPFTGSTSSLVAQTKTSTSAKES